MKTKNFPQLIFLVLLSLALLVACGRPDPADIGADQSDREVDAFVEHPGNPAAGSAQVAPVAAFPFVHGSLGLKYAGLNILIDPYDGAERYADFGAPDLVLITHTHPDHLDKQTLAGIDLSAATLIAPQAVMEASNDVKFAARKMLANGDTAQYKGNTILAVPAYNYPPAKFHPQGQFNGYVLQLGQERIYVSGDTGPAPELRELTDIDQAFVCMNQPYTMTVESAADLVAAFQPDVVRPYHYRNQDGSFSDLEKFRTLLKEKAPAVNVLIEDWYAEEERK